MLAAAALPVPVDLLHYTETEFTRVLAGDGRMARVLTDEARWWVSAPFAVAAVD